MTPLSHLILFAIKNKYPRRSKMAEEVNTLPLFCEHSKIATEQPTWRAI